MKRFLALFAMLLVLLRPLCDVQAAGAEQGELGARTHATANYHADEAAACIAELEDRSLATLGAVAPGAGDGKLAFATPGLIAAHYADTPHVARHPSGAVITAPSFYARSARIRR